MIPCETAAVLIERRLDGEASPEDDARLDAHVTGCPSCATALEQELALDAALTARFQGAQPSPAFAAAVRARVAAEPSPAAGWIPDLLNAAGVLLVLVLAVPVTSGWGGLTGILLTMAALAAALYPLLLTMWAHDAGSATQADPAA